jgi:hypothetical protein
MVTNDHIINNSFDKEAFYLSKIAHLSDKENAKLYEHDEAWKESLKSCSAHKAKLQDEFSTKIKI